MKKSLLIATFLISISSFAQKDCEYSSNVKDSLGTYRSTIDYVMHEKVFGNSQTSVSYTHLTLPTNREV